MKQPIMWAREACDSIMTSFTPEQLPPAGRWHYHQGVFLQGMEKLWRATGEAKYLQYIKAYVDLYLGVDGSLEVKDHLDDIMPGQLLLLLDQESGEPKYRKAADFLRNLLDSWKTTSDGGFWHKDIYPNQMWLDGIYMEGPFAVKYAVLYNDPALFDLVVEQALLMHKHTLDKDSGLLYHGWDETRTKDWANPETGCSPEFWGRAVGWYLFAMTEILDDLPGDHPKRQELTGILHGLAEAVVRVQDRRTGLWHQVLDKGERADNWLELSCSTLFVGGIAKAVKDHGLDAAYLPAVRAGYAGVLERIGRLEDGRLQIPDICIGTGVGNYEHYVNRPRSVNDLHGVATFVHMCMAMHQLEQD